MKESDVQPIGDEVLAWQGAKKPVATFIEGRYCDLQPLEVERHYESLFAAFSEDVNGNNWTYLPASPPPHIIQFKQWLIQTCNASELLFYAIIEKQSDCAIGMAALMRVDAANGVIEVGHIHFSLQLQKTPMATEAMYLLMRQVFNWGYRRYEWKCDSLNAPSRRAAQRLGFSFEGVFRQAVVYKGRNRDTAWFSILDGEWPKQQGAFERWLATDNFDESGRQRQALSELLEVEAKS